MTTRPTLFGLSVEMDETGCETIYCVSSKVVSVQSPYGSYSKQTGRVSAHAFVRLHVGLVELRTGAALHSRIPSVQSDWYSHAVVMGCSLLSRSETKRPLEVASGER